MSVTKTITMQGWSENGMSKGQIFVMSWRVVSDADLSIDKASDIVTIQSATCGEILSPLPTVTWSTSALNTTLRLRKYDIQPVIGGKARVFDVRATYDSEYVWAKATGLNKLILPVEVEMEAGERTMQVWRNPTFGTQPAADLNTTADIGGVKVDEAGKPMEFRVPTLSVRISLVNDVSNNSTGTLNSIMDAITSVRGRWNSNTFLWFSSNSVYCTSANVSHIRDEYYRSSYCFVWDQYYDCSQYPQMDNDGHIYGDGSGHAKNVYWKSLKRYNVDLNLIFDTCPDVDVAKQMSKEGSYLTYP